MNTKMKTMSLHAARPAAIVACLAGMALSVPALGGSGICEVTQYGMPDFDQRRELLNDDGSVHCVPTSIANMLGYFATRGVPQAFPGVDKTFGQEDYGQITNHIALLGAFSGTSPPGGTGGTDGLNGLKAFLAFYAPGKFTAIRVGGGGASPINMIVYRNALGGYISFCYGRYTFVGGATGWQRGGGHCVTLHKLNDGCTSSPDLSYRDPASDEGASDPDRLDKQSISGVTTFPIVARPGTYSGITRTLWEMQTGSTDGRLRLLESMYVIFPQVAIDTSGPQINIKPAFVPVNTDPPASINTNATILNVKLATDSTSMIVVHPGRTGAPGSLRQVNPLDGSVRTLASVDSKLIGVGRRGLAYGVDGSELVAVDTKPQPPLPPVELARVTLPRVPEGLGVDPRTDQVAAFLPGTVAAPQIALFNRSLGSPSIAFYPALPGTGELKIKPGPQPGQWYLARVGDMTIKLIQAPSAVGQPWTNVGTVDLPGIDTVVDFEFLDGGLVYSTPVAAGNPALVMRGAKLDSLGRWVADPDNSFHGRSAGAILAFSTSVDNYDPAIDGPDDSIGPNPEVFPSEPDCIADIASPGAFAQPDGELTADDIILFIRWFTGGDERADVAGPGPVAGPDSERTADDIILFINSFFAGC